MEFVQLNLPNPPDFQGFRNDASSTLASPSADLVQALLGFPAAAGKPVTRTTAIRVAAFLSAVRVLCNDVAKLPLILRETSIVNGRQRTQPAIDNPLYSILKDAPNEFQTSYQARWFLASQLIMRGNCFCQKITNALGEVTGLMPLDAWQMSPHWDRSNPKKPVLLWKYSDGAGNIREFKQSELWHVTNNNFDGNGIEGASIIALAKESLSLLMAAEETAGRTFANGLGMGGFICFPPDVTVNEAQGQNVIDRLKKDFAGSQNAGKFSVLPYGGKFDKMTWNAQESQLIESRKWNEETIARTLGSKPLCVKLGYGGEAAYASNSAFLDDYFNTCLAPICIAIEQSITRDLIAPKDRGKLYAKHNADIFLRGSPSERAKTNAELINSFQLTPNEARQIEDRDTVDGGDFLCGGTGTPVIFDPVEQEFFIPGQKVPEPEENDQTTTKPGEPEPDAQGSNDDNDTTEPVTPPAKAKPSKAKARLEAIANSLAERVMRKEAKGGIDAKFVAEVLSISKEKAEAYIEGRAKLSNEEARAALFALVTGD